MTISIIAAVADNGVIGRNGDLPWRLRSDLQRFRKLTYGKTVIVGRKTHESILQRLGHPLEGRRTIVVTRQPHYAAECEVAYSLDEALERSGNDEEVFIIGGRELYQEALPRAERLYLTRVHATPFGDTKFPDSWKELGLTRTMWSTYHVEYYPAGPGDEFDSTFQIMKRARTASAVARRYSW